MRVLLAVHITYSVEVLERLKQIGISGGNVTIVARIAEVDWLRKRKSPL